MANVTRGTLLATLKELRKHKRPKASTAAVSVQAICPKKSVTVDKNADLQASIERRRTLLHTSSIVPYYTTEEYARFVSMYEDFVQDYVKNKKPRIVAVVKNATEDLSNRSCPAD